MLKPKSVSGHWRNCFWTNRFRCDSAARPGHSEGFQISGYQPFSCRCFPPRRAGGAGADLLWPGLGRRSPGAAARPVGQRPGGGQPPHAPAERECPGPGGHEPSGLELNFCRRHSKGPSGHSPAQGPPRTAHTAAQDPRSCVFGSVQTSWFLLSFRFADGRGFS